MADSSWLAGVRRSGWAGSGPQATQSAEDRKDPVAGSKEYSSSMAQNKYADKTQSSEQADAMKRRMQVAGN